MIQFLCVITIAGNVHYEWHNKNNFQLCFSHICSHFARDTETKCNVLSRASEVILKVVCSIDRYQATKNTCAQFFGPKIQTNLKAIDAKNL